MYSNNSKHRGATSAQVFMARFTIMLAMALGLIALPAAAAPFVYVVNEGDGTVSVIDTATNTVAGTPIPVGDNPFVVTVAPDGKHAYVTNLTSNSVSVIDTATNTLDPTVIMVGNRP